MAGPLLYVSKVVRLPLLDADGTPVGGLDDAVLGPPHGNDAPPVIGFVATVQRRRIFVNAGRVGTVDALGVRLHSGTIDLRHFQLRSGELLAMGGVVERRVGGEVIRDVGLGPSPARARSWEVATVALSPTGGLRRRRVSRIVPWHQVAE